MIAAVKIKAKSYVNHELLMSIFSIYISSVTEPQQKSLNSDVYRLLA